MINKKYISITEHLNIVGTINHFNKIGIKTIPKNKNKILRILGFGCLIIAVLPNGLSPLFFPLSFMLLGITIHDLKKYKKKVYFDVQYQIKKRAKYKK